MDQEIAQEVKGDEVISVGIADIKTLPPEEQNKILKALATDSLTRAEKNYPSEQR